MRLALLMNVCLMATVASPAWLLAGQPMQSEKARFVLDEIAVGLDRPWGLAILPDGRMLVTEKAGRLRIVGRDGKLSKPLLGTPKVDARGQGGLLDVALDPDF